MPKTSRQNEQGFSLIELLIALLIFLIVTGAAYGVMEAARRSRSVTNQQSQLNKEVRVALNLLGRDTYNAGFGYPTETIVKLPDNSITTLLAIPADFNTDRDTVPPIIAGNNVTLNTVNTTANTFTDQVTFLFKDSTFNLVGTAPNQVSQSLNINAPTTVSGIDQIVPITGSNSACRVNDIFIIMGNTSSALGLVTGLNGTSAIQLANGDFLGINQTGSLSSITLPASLLRVNMVTYFVTGDGVLTRREYANSMLIGAGISQNWRDEPLIYNVENFQIRYVMDNGTISDNPGAGADGVAGTADDDLAILDNVRQVRFTVNVRSTQLNSANQPYRVSMTSTFGTRNLGY